MTRRTSFLKRCLAMAVALVLMISNAAPGLAVQASAAENSVMVGELIASNYALSDAEKALLNSGYLAGDTEVTYDAPSDEWVSVDFDTKTITAESKNGWVPATADILVDGNPVQAVEFDGNTAVHTYDGNAYAVRVNYELYESVDIATQTAMLDAGFIMKDGIGNVATLLDASGSLDLLELAMPTLAEYAETGYVVGNSDVVNDEAKTAINAVWGEMNAEGNDGHLVMTNLLDSSSYKTSILLKKGAEIEAALDSETMYHIETINEFCELVLTLSGFNEIPEDLLGHADTLNGVLNNWFAAVDAVADADWSADTSMLGDNVNYKELDELVDALDTVSGVAVNEALFVTDASVQANLNMTDVTVKVVLMKVEDKVDSDELVTADSMKITQTLSQSLTAEEIETAIEAAVAEADDIVTDTDNYEISEKSDMPESLTDEAVEYTVTYKPVKYTVTTNYADEKEVYYGHQLTLPTHDDEEQAYDYIVNGEALPQGTVYTVEGNTEITRKAGAAYIVYNLYEVVANNYGNDAAKAILTSGALDGNMNIPVRMPKTKNAAEMLKLINGELQVLEAGKAFPADYAGLSWVPYSYGTSDKAEDGYFEGTDPVSFSGEPAYVKYALYLTNIGTDKVAEVLALAETLEDEADGQTAVLDTLLAYKGTMAQLNKTKLGALGGMIDVTDFEQPDSKEKFKGVVSTIIASHLEGNDLRIYTMVENYEANGLRYYYNNADAIIAEINALSDQIAILADDSRKADLETMLGLAELDKSYVEKIEGLSETLENVKANLTTPNAVIDLESENLSKLLTALVDDKTSVDNKAADTAYITSDPLTVQDSSKVMVEITLKKQGSTDTMIANVTGIPVNTELTQDMVDALNADIAKKASELLNGYEAYYSVSAQDDEKNEIDDLDARVGDILDGNLFINYVYAPESYKVSVEGADDAYVTIENRDVKVPGPADPAYRYDYTLDGETKKVVFGTTSVFTLTDEQLVAAKAGGLTITREEVNIEDERQEDTYDAIYDEFGTELNEKGEKVPNGKVEIIEKDGQYAGLNVTVSTTGDVADVAMILADKYSYVELNDRPFVWTNADGSLNISVQALLDAMLEDETFSSDKLIELGTKGEDNVYGGNYINATMNLGQTGSQGGVMPASEDEIPHNIEKENQTLIINIESAHDLLKQVAGGLKDYEDYIEFQSDNGKLNVNVTLHEKVYEVYLTALLATSEIDKNDVNAVNNEIAYNFLADYVEIILDSNATTTTFQNTLDKVMGKVDGVVDVDVPQINSEKAEKLYQMVKKALIGPSVNVEENDVNNEISVTATKDGIYEVLETLTIDLPDKYEAQIAELKEGGSIHIDTVATLTNLATEYKALVLDLDNAVSNVTSKDLEATAAMFNYTADVAGAAAGIEERGAIILLADVEGNLDIPGTAIVDLNGKTVTGQIISTSGNVYVVDSCLGAAKCGEVTGGVSGNVTVMGGKYPAGLGAKFMPDFYVQDAASGVVRNALYELKAGNVSSYGIELSKEFFTKENLKHYGLQAATVAADVAIDIALNFYDSSALKVNDYTLMAVNYADILDLIDGKKGTLANIFDETLNDIYFEDDGISGLANEIIKDLLAWDKIIDSIETGSTINTYTAVASPWKIQIDHVEDGDYLTVGLVTDSETVAHDASVTLYVPASVGEQIPESVVKALKELDRITPTKEAEIHLTQPVREGKDLLVGGTAEANFEVDLTATVYKHLLAIALANGNPEVSEDLLASMDDDDAMKAIVNKMNVKDVLESVAALDTKTIDKMCEELGTSVDSIVEKIESKFDVKITDEHINNVLEILAAGTNKVLNWLDGHEILTKTMGGIEIDNSGTYGFVDADAFRDGRKEKWGFGVQYDLAITNATLKVHIFGEAPKTEEENRGYLRLDLHPIDGMTLEELESKYVIEDLADYKLAMELFTAEGKPKARTEKVATTDLLKVTATKSTTTRIINYVIVVMGDTNCNGKNDSGDASKMMRMYYAQVDGRLETDYRSEAVRLAADCNLNNKVDSGDASRIRIKYNNVNRARTTYGAGSAEEIEVWQTWIEDHDLGFVVD